MKNNQFLLAALVMIIALSTTLSSCKPDKHDHDGQETITTLKLKLTPTGSSAQEVFTFKNLNGVTTKDTVVLSSGSSYIATLEVLDETKSPAEDITVEIAEEKNEHQFFFVTSPTGLVTFSNFDKDSNGKDVGLISTFTTTSVGKGTLQVVLKHLGEDPKTGNITNGESDLDVVFEVVVQ
jgi:hypothetical protein